MKLMTDIYKKMKNSNKIIINKICKKYKIKVKVLIRHV